MESEWAKANRLARVKKWRIDNPEKVKAQKLAWYEKNRQKQINYSKKYIEENAEIVKLKRAEYLKKNADRLREQYKAYYEKNRDKIRAKCAAYLANNPEAALVRNQNRRARKKSAEGKYTANDVNKIFKLQKGRCASCAKCLDKTGKHVDHIVPLSKGGSNWPDNLQILCPTCNVKKGARHPLEWANINGKLI